MYIKTISLYNFRNYDDLHIELSPKLNIIYGNNAQGKTNILESIYMCAMGRSPKAQKDKEIIKLDKKEAHIRIYASKKGLENKIDVHLKKEAKKGIAVNGIPIKKLNELFGVIYVVIFSPEDLQLIKSGPSERRRFIDMELCQLNSIYYYDLQQYCKVLKQRNNLLKRLSKEPSWNDTLFIWDKQLVFYGKRVIRARDEFIKRLNDISSQIHADITNNSEIMNLKYIPNIKESEFEFKLNRNLEKDLILKSTSVGPHKDELQFFINNQDVKIYGSQGQQRTTALSVKLAEIKLIEEETSIKPVLLLDDVLSELDESRQSYLLKNINNLQTILTCTGIEDSIRKYIGKAYILEVKNNSVHSFV